ncbi:hypothetical protein [Lysobacter brunescens]|uniref:Uncharacterized protein n=1 Tax=Lysobacter brunescens TaxID=262323 RepID=A0ABW2YEM3_9GAMM
MSSTPTRSPGQKPLAILIAAQMRPMPGGLPGGVKSGKPINVNKALRKAMNSSPQAKVAFKQNKAAVNQAKPHLQALANRQGQGLMSSLKHGVSAMRSLKQVTRDMAKQPGANKLKVESNVPLNAKAQKHMDGITQAMEGPKPKLFSALGQGIGLMRELRKTTQQMKQESKRAQHADARTLSPMPKTGGGPEPGDGKSTTQAIGKSTARQTGKPFAETVDLLRTLGQGVRMMQGLKQVTKTMKTAETQGTLMDGALRFQSLSSTSPRNGESPLAIMLIARRGGSSPGNESKD